MRSWYKHRMCGQYQSFTRTGTHRCWRAVTLLFGISLSSNAHGVPGAPGLLDVHAVVTNSSPAKGQIIVGIASRIEWLNPANGQALHRQAPIDVRQFVWQRFIHRGDFVLAEGLGDSYRTRGLALLQRDGRVLWSQTHYYGNRMSQYIYLGVDGIVAFDTPSGARIVKPTGEAVPTGNSVPIGPPTRGVVPIKPFTALTCGEQSHEWLYFDRLIHSHDAPAFADADLNLIPVLSRGRLSIVKALKTHPQRPFENWSNSWQLVSRRVASVAIPAYCFEARIAQTASSSHFILQCKRAEDHYVQLLVDVHTKRVTTLYSPGKQMDSPCEVSSMTLNNEGTAYASVWHGCTASVHRADSPWRWSTLRSFDTTVPLSISSICGHLVLRRDPYKTGNCSCGSPTVDEANSVVKAYVQQQDGTWLALPYEVAELKDGCSPDGHTTAAPFERDKRVGISIVSLDHVENQIVEYAEGSSGAGLGSIVPLVWVQ